MFSYTFASDSSTTVDTFKEMHSGVSVTHTDTGIEDQTTIHQTGMAWV